MNVQSILSVKGTQVATIAHNASIADAVAPMADDAEPVIELTETVDDEPLIDLTEVVAAPDEDEAVIDLTEEVAALRLADHGAGVRDVPGPELAERRLAVAQQGPEVGPVAVAEALAVIASLDIRHTEAGLDRSVGSHRGAHGGLAVDGAVQVRVGAAGGAGIELVLELDAAQQLGRRRYRASRARFPRRRCAAPGDRSAPGGWRDR